MLFSIIVPVYNVEKYIKECIDSIVNQDFKDYELLLIDDGTPDKSGHICDEYASRYDNVFSFHKENGGLSSARNFALDRAKGKYVIFIDSDDWIEAGCLKKLADYLKDNDADVIATIKHNAINNTITPEVSGFGEYISKGFNRERALNWILYDSNSMGAVNQILSLKFINDNNLRFIDGILHEDLDWMCKTCMYAKTFGGIDIHWYNYRINSENSIMHNISAKNITDVIYTVSIYYDIYKKDKTELSKKIFYRALDSAFYSFRRVKYLNSEGLKVVEDCIKDNIEIYYYPQNMKQRMVTICLRVLGVRNTLKLARRM